MVTYAKKIERLLSDAERAHAHDSPIFNPRPLPVTSPGRQIRLNLPSSSSMWHVLGFFSISFPSSLHSTIHIVYPELVLQHNIYLVLPIQNRMLAYRKHLSHPTLHHIPSDLPKHCSTDPTIKRPASSFVFLHLGGGLNFL